LTYRANKLIICAMPHFARNTSLESLFRFAASLGIRADEICDAIGLDIQAATINGGLIPAAAVIDAVEWVAAASDTANFGLLMAERIEPRIIGLPALIAEQCRSIPDYYDLLQAHLGQHTTGYSFALDHDEFGGVGRLRIISRGRHEPRHFAETVLAVHIRTFPQFLGAMWRPSKVLLAHDQLGRTSDYARAFGAEVVFRAGYNAIIFSAKDLLWRAAERGNDMRRQLQQVAAAAQNDLVGRTSMMIRMLLPSRDATITAVAATLSMQPRTLQRKLLHAGTSFSCLLAETRIGLARDYLGREAISATEAAARLGFAEVSVFSRFVRKHIGVSPRALTKPMR
jgi:AraC-like DNA-binding protein